MSAIEVHVHPLHSNSVETFKVASKACPVDKSLSLYHNSSFARYLFYYLISQLTIKYHFLHLETNFIIKINCSIHITEMYFIGTVKSIRNIWYLILYLSIKLKLMSVVSRTFPPYGSAL